MNHRKLLHSLLVASGAVVVVVLVVAMWIGSSRTPGPPPDSEPPPDAEMRLTDMEYTEMQGGRRLWALKADEARYFQSQQESVLKSVHLTFFLENGEEVHLRSEEGILYTETKNIELWSSVRSDLPRSYVIETDHAYYDHEKKLLYSNTPVHVTGKDMDLTGQQWTFNIPERSAALEGGVTASVRLNPPDEGKKE